MPRRRFFEALLATAAAGQCFVGACGAAEATAHAGAAVIDAVFVSAWIEEAGSDRKPDTGGDPQLAKAVHVGIEGSEVSHTTSRFSTLGETGVAVAIELE